MNILSLDLGTKTGWALRLASGEIHSGTEDFNKGKGRFEGGGMRYLRFNRWLTEVTGGDSHERHRPQLVTFEEVRKHQGVDAAHAYGGFLAHLTAWCELRGVAYQAVPVATIKKHVTGKGNASKEQMIAAMVAMNYQPGDDNEADALAIMEWTCAQGFNKADHETTRNPRIRPAPDSKPRRRIPMGPDTVARKRVRV